MSKIIVNDTYCKGCGLCVTVCPEHIIEMSTDTLTAKGYRPARMTDESKCTACTFCATICPDIAITVVKE